MKKSKGKISWIDGLYTYNVSHALQMCYHNLRDYIRTWLKGKSTPVEIEINNSPVNRGYIDGLYLTIELSKENNVFSEENNILLGEDFLQTKEIFIDFIDPITKEKWLTTGGFRQDVKEDDNIETNKV